MRLSGIDLLIIIFTDGACSPNPGQGGIGAVLIFDSGQQKKIEEISRAIGHSTNNRAETWAIIDALRAVPDIENAKVLLYMDSRLLCNQLTKTRKGWMWKAKLNKDLIAEARDLVLKCASFQIKWVRGHNGNLYNERADFLAVRARS